MRTRKDGSTYQSMLSSEVKVRLFDHARLAAAIEAATHTAVEAHRLPLDNLDIEDETGRHISFEVKKDHLSCDVQSYVCETKASPSANSLEIVSPNGEFAVKAQDDNLWIRSLASGEEHCAHPRRRAAFFLRKDAGRESFEHSKAIGWT